VSACARCGFALSDRATKCLFCGQVVGAALPEEGARPTPQAGTADPALAPPTAATEPSGRIPRLTVPYRRPADLDADAASTPPSSPLSRPGFGEPEPTVPAVAPEGPVAPVAPGGSPAPAVTTRPSSRSSLATTLVIAALVGAIAGGLAFLVFIALRG